MRLLLYYFVVISLFSCVITVHDKLAAKRHARRVPERVLLLFAALGGSLSMYVTMLLIRHKTRHAKFMIGIPIIIVVQICLVLFLLRKQALI